MCFSRTTFRWVDTQYLYSMYIYIISMFLHSKQVPRGLQDHLKPSFHLLVDMFVVGSQVETPAVRDVDDVTGRVMKKYFQRLTWPSSFLVLGASVNFGADWLN